MSTNGITQSLEVPVGHFWYDINVDSPQRRSLQTTGETAEYEVFDVMEVEHLAEVSQLLLFGVLCQIAAGPAVR